MGLFSRWTNKESSAKETPVEAPKTEAKEEKSATETGRERVAKMQEGISETWNKFGSKAKEGGKWLLKRAFELGFGAIGGVEKGAKKASAGIEAGKASVKEYSTETRQEAGELAESFGTWAEGAANEIGQGAEMTIDSLNKWAQKKVDRYNEVRDAAKADFEGGVMKLNTWADEKVAKWNQFKTNAENTPQDLEKAWEQLKAEVATGISERFTLLQEGARKDYARASEAMSQRVGSFRSEFNNKGAEFFGTAELKGEVAELKELVARQGRLIDQLTALQNAKVETPIEEEGKGVVEYASREASA